MFLLTLVSATELAFDNEVGTGFNATWDNFLGNLIGGTIFGTSGNFTSNLTVDTNTFFVDSVLNRVGINTSTPQNTLNVLGDVNVSVGSIFVDEDHFIQLGDSGLRLKRGSAVFGADFLRLGTSSGMKHIGTPSALSFWSNTGTDGSGTFEPGWVLQANGGMNMFNTNQGDVANRFLNIDFSSGVHIESGNLSVDNNIGIGTTTPQNTLNVIGDGNITGIFYVGEFSGPINWTNLQNYPVLCPSGTFLTQLDDSVTCTAPVADDVDPGNFPAGNYSFDTNTLFIDSVLNRVGIGTNSPGFKLVVNSSEINTVASFQSTDTRASIKIEDSTDAAFVVMDNTIMSLGHLGRAAIANGINILSDGKVGMGTNNPQHKLDVRGNGSFTGNLYFGNALTEFIRQDLSEGINILELNSLEFIDFVVNGTKTTTFSIDAMGPVNDNVIDLSNSVVRWRNLYLGSNADILGNLTVGGNLSLEFGDLVSEQNPDGADAIRIKGTDYIDIVIGGMTGLFAIWNVADTIPIFYVNERGDTNIAGDLIVDTNTLFADAGNNRIGVLTTTPQNTLNVLGDGNFTGNLTADIYFGNGSQLDGVLKDTGDTATGSYVFNDNLSIGNSVGGEGWYIYQDTLSSYLDSIKNGIKIRTERAVDKIGFYPNRTLTLELRNTRTLMYVNLIVIGGNITADYIFADRVGINTLTPQNTLNVLGDGNFTGNLTIGDKLTFSFGEFIDNLVDGWLRVTGNLNVTGNFTGNQFYGETNIHPDGNITVIINTQGVHENITGFNESTSNGFTLIGNHSLRVDIAGVYDADFWISSSGGVNKIYESCLAVNGEHATPHAHRRQGTPGDIGSISGGGILLLNEGDMINLQIKNTEGTQNVDIFYAGMRFDRIGNL